MLKKTQIFLTIFCFQLPQDCTWQNLRDLCKTFGDVRYAEILGGGTGRVRFAYEVTARKAAGKSKFC